MYAHHAALWSTSSSDDRDRTSNHKRTKQRGKEDWTWEDILDGKGSWTWEILAERDRGQRGTGNALCYAVERTVSPVRVHSPVRYIPAPSIGRARVGIQPGRMVPAQHSWPPVRLYGPGYPAPALRTVSPVRLHSPVHPVPAPRRGRARVSIQPGRVVPALRSRPPVVIHGPKPPVMIHGPKPPVVIHGTKPPVMIHGPKPPWIGVSSGGSQSGATSRGSQSGAF